MLSCIIPAHNEEKRISKTLNEYCSKFIDAEVIVSLNACTDNTLAVVKDFQKIYSNLKYIESDIGAKGAAVIAGFRAAKGDFIGFVDADCSTSAEEYSRMIQSIKKSRYDGIIASRYMAGSIVSPKQSLGRIVVSRLFNAFIRCMLQLPYKDTQCGAKIFRKEAIQRILPDLKTNKWGFDVDLLYQMKRHGYRIREYPTKWSDAEYSKLNIRSAGPNMLLAIIRLRLLYSPFRFIVKLYDKIK